MFFSNYPSIVALHYVSDDAYLDPLRPWVVSHAAFIRLLDYLESEHYSTVLTKDVVYGYVPPKAIMLTFDDCPKHLMDFAVPELVKRNMRAVFFITTANIGGCNKWGVEEGMPRLDLMDEDDIRKLADMGMEIGSHAHEHVMLTDFDRDYVQQQLSLSKKILERIIKKKVLSIAYPYGFVPAGYKKIVKKNGYKLGLSVETVYDSKYALRRWVFTDEDDYVSIAQKMSFSYNVRRTVTDKVDFISQRIMSALYRTYKKLKNMFVTLLGFLFMYLGNITECILHIEEDIIATAI